ncbi:hypothetical protein [uncultured Pseudomonas sp.]|uniref:hypothetical protein n=1 Tax=uncultured Pseudomonas sp. TaxID=114707 RepID=UPI0025F3C050|nr:hypothetical protein [uncultured Pseudomonas sp.]
MHCPSALAGRNVSGLPTQSRTLSPLPLRLMVVMMICCLLNIAVRYLCGWLNDSPEDFQRSVEDIWNAAMSWPGALALEGCLALLLTRWYLQHHGLLDLTGYTRTIALLASLNLLSSIVLNRLYRMFWQTVIDMQDPVLSRTLIGLLQEPMNILFYVLTTLLPLWLSLHVARISGHFEAGRSAVGRTELALAFGLTFSLFCTKFLDWLKWITNGYHSSDAWALAHMVCALYALVACIAALRYCAPYTAALPVGRLLYRVTLCAGLWLAAVAQLYWGLAMLGHLGLEFLIKGFVPFSALTLAMLLWALTKHALQHFNSPAPGEPCQRAPRVPGESRLLRQLPVQAMIAMMICSALSIASRWFRRWLQMPPEMFQYYLHDLWRWAATWPAELATKTGCALLLVLWYMQRHDLKQLIRPGRWLALFFILYLILYLILYFGLGTLYQLLEQLLRPWLDDRETRHIARLPRILLNQGHFLLLALLPLWLSLHLTRTHGQVESGPSPVTRAEAALLFGLMFHLAYQTLLTLALTFIDSTYELRGAIAVSQLAGLLYGAVAMAAAYRFFAQPLPRLQVRRLLGSLAVCMMVWLVVLAQMGSFLFVLIESRRYGDAEFYTLPFGFILLGLLWPLTQLSLRLVYRPTTA